MPMFCYTQNCFTAPVMFVLCSVILACAMCSNAVALPREGMIETSESPGAFCLVKERTVAPVVVDSDDFPGVIRAANDLASDIFRVTKQRPEVLGLPGGAGATPILVGTLEKSPLIRKLVESGKLDAASITGKWESFVIEVVEHPMDGVERALIIAGSDKRGTIYGIYEVSESIGVSPWLWWADVPPATRDSLFVKAGRYVQTSPAVKYRGIFINDEAPCLTGWASKQFGGLNSKFYTKVFELLLRLRANYMWPAMWGSAFNEDDPENARLADEYGIVMGTSHQEPMLRAQAEFDRKHKAELWNYATHPQVMEEFWRNGVRRNKAFESIITMGMRGRNDSEMLAGATIKQSSDLLQTIVTRQRQILAEEVNADVTSIPQMWCLYKEVQDYYEKGLRVPDDITLLWADDNWGNLRRVPTSEELKRSGGAGIYYHFDYVGGPRSYKWINTNPLPKIQEQMNIAYQHGADRIWIVNVGDIKPVEMPLQFFLEMAWDPTGMSKDKVAEFTKRWAAQQFGAEHADAVADIVSRYGKYNGWRKPELVDPKTYSILHYQEADRVEKAWTELAADAEALNEKIPSERRDAYFQLVLYPAKACATVTRLYIAAARNSLYVKQGRTAANSEAKRVKDLFELDKSLTDMYHRVADGKWDRMMAQTHIGFTTWSDPKENNMPQVQNVSPASGVAVGVAVEGKEEAWPAAQELTLPAIDTLGDQSRWIDVFARGDAPVEFTASTKDDWLKIRKQAPGALGDTRILVSVDWGKAPSGKNQGSITISAGEERPVSINVPLVHALEVADLKGKVFGNLTEAYSIPADAFERNVAAAGAEWQALPDYGRVKAAMSVFPVTAKSVMPPQQSPCLEYSAYFPQSGEVQIDAILSPTLPYVDGRGLRLGLSIDGGDPQILDASMRASYSDPHWGESVKNNARVLRFKQTIETAGQHTIKVWMVDPGVVLQQLIVGKARPSYFGPLIRE